MCWYITGSAYDRVVSAPTFPSDAPVKKIDYVMYYPKDRWKVVSAEVICDSVASDHCAHFVTLELLSAEEEWSGLQDGHFFRSHL